MRLVRSIHDFIIGAGLVFGHLLVDSWWMSSFRWKLQRKFTEFTGLGPDGNRPFAFLDDAITDREAKAHALADIFGGKERIKNFVQMFRGNSRAVIADDQGALAVFEAAFDPNRGLFVCKRLSFQGVQGILQQVYEHMNELVLICPDGLVFRKVLLDLHAVFPFVAHEA